LSGTSSSIRTKLWWNSHWMVLFQNCVRQSRSPTKMAATGQLRCYWKQLWSRWAITGSWEPLVYICRHFCGIGQKGFFFFIVIKNLVVIVQANLSFFFFIIVTVIWTMTFCLILYLHPCPFILNYICEDFFFNYLSWQFW
jgi:hypothetical protein